MPSQMVWRLASSPRGRRLDRFSEDDRCIRLRNTPVRHSACCTGQMSCRLNKPRFSQTGCHHPGCCRRNRQTSLWAADASSGVRYRNSVSVQKLAQQFAPLSLPFMRALPPRFCFRPESPAGRTAVYLECAKPQPQLQLPLWPPAPDRHPDSDSTRAPPQNCLRHRPCL